MSAISYVPSKAVGGQQSTPQKNLSNSNLRDVAALKRVNFLYTAAHAVAASNPNLSRVYLSSMKEQARASHIELTDAVTTRICDECHALLIPGSTATSRLVARRRSPRMKIALDTAGDATMDEETTEGFWHPEKQFYSSPLVLFYYIGRPRSLILTRF